MLLNSAEYCVSVWLFMLKAKLLYTISEDEDKAMT